MSRCLREREVFALLDGSIKPSARARAEQHLAACRDCAARVAALDRLRTAARDALPPLEPDWTKINPAIEHAIAEVTRRPSPGIAWLPLGLSFAAAALVAIALFVSLPVEEPDPGAADRPELAVVPRPVRAIAQLELLELRVTESSSRLNRPAAAALLAAGDTASTSTDGELRIALGPQATIDVYPSSRIDIYSDAALSPAVELVAGTSLFHIPVGALERELVVLAGDAVFTVLDGTFELSVTEDGLVVAVIDGQVGVAGRDEPTALAAGSWRSERASNDREEDWLKLRLAPVDADAGIAGEELAEREWYRPTGTLPKRVVRDTLSRAKPSLKACYETALKRFPELEVSVTARVSVGLRGQVSRVRLRGGERWPELERCITTVLGQMSFPPPSGGPVDLIFPLRLSPER
jgi:ferric-dicitrate binding protein FerR (iron transport regulator)